MFLRRKFLRLAIIVAINGSGKLTILSTKSGIKADGVFYGLGGELIITAGTGHGISAYACIMQGVGYKNLNRV